MTQSTRKPIFWMTLILASMAVAVPARADLLLFQGIQGGADDTSNVLFNSVEDILGPATLVRGHIQGGLQIDFSSATQNLVATNHGSGNLTAAEPGAVFDALSIFFGSGETFTKAIFNVNAARDGDLTIGVRAADGSLASATFDLNGHGNNFFTVNALNGERIREIDIASSVDLNNIGQVRLGGSGDVLHASEPSGMAVAPVPEPDGMALLGAGVLAPLILWKLRAKRR